MKRLRDYWNLYAHTPRVKLQEGVLRFWQSLPVSARNFFIVFFNYFISAIMLTFLVYTVIHKLFVSHVWILILDLMILLVFSHYFCRTPHASTELWICMCQLWASSTFFDISPTSSTVSLSCDSSQKEQP